VKFVEETLEVIRGRVLVAFEAEKFVDVRVHKFN
jgi:hypothetical protein